MAGKVSGFDTKIWRVWFTIQRSGRAKRGASGALNLQSAQQGLIPHGGFTV